MVRSYVYFFCPDTQGFTPDELEKYETLPELLQQVGPRDVWLQFEEVEKLVGMGYGSMTDIWSKMRPTAHGRTRQRTTLTTVEGNLGKAGLFFVEGYLALVDSGKPKPDWRGTRYSDIAQAVTLVSTSRPSDLSEGASGIRSDENPTLSTPSTLEVSSVAGSAGDTPNVADSTSPDRNPTQEGAEEGAESPVRDTVIDVDDIVRSDSVEEVDDACDLRAVGRPDVSRASEKGGRRVVHGGRGRQGQTIYRY